MTARRGSLKQRLLTVVTGSLLVTAAAVVAALLFQLSKQGEELVERRAIDLALVLAGAVRAAVDFEDEDGADRALGILADARGARWAVVLRADGTQLARRVLDERAAPELPRGVTDGAAARTFARGSELIAYAPVVTAEGGVRGALFVGFSLDELHARIRAVAALALMLSIVVVATGAALTWVLAGRVVRPIAALTSLTRQIVETRDLRIAVPVKGDDEIGDLAKSFDQLVTDQRHILRAVRESADSLGGESDRIAAAGRAVKQGSADIRAQIDGTSRALATTQDALKSLKVAVRALEETNATGGARIVEVVRTVEGAVGSVREMTSKGQAAAESIGKAAASMRRMAQSIEVASGALTGVSRVAGSVEVAIKDVEGRARAAADLSDRSAADAELGRAALRRAGAASRDIRSTLDGIEGVLAALRERLHEVGSVVRVIQDVADQTNLLSLNASIIAAQAGHDGHGFSVVAAEIKALAARTGSSSAFIAGVVHDIIEQSEATLRATRSGVASIDEGLAVSEEAAARLDGILSSSSQTGTALRGIAEAAVRQVRETRAVTEEVQRAQLEVDEIRLLSAEQARMTVSTEEIVNKLGALSKTVDDALRLQAHGTREILDAISRLGSVIDDVRRSEEGQEAAAQRVLAALDAISAVCARQSEPVESLEEAIDALRSSAAVLEREVGAFHA